jgi:cytochrome b6-f complex iron-sulfur subunit
MTGREITPRPAAQPAYGVGHGPPVGEITRRQFMRRALGVGVGLITLQFIGGTIAFLWPQLEGGLGTIVTLGTAEDINQANPDWATGTPHSYAAARAFIINVPAAMAKVEAGPEAVAAAQELGIDVPDPGEEVLALYRKCPHLGCQIPPLCQASLWFECLCHGSMYTILGERRAGPTTRGMDRFSVSLEDGVYMVDTREIIAGPPQGTVTFDPRAREDMGHCV